MLAIKIVIVCGLTTLIILNAPDYYNLSKGAWFLTFVFLADRDVCVIFRVENHLSQFWRFLKGNALHLCLLLKLVNVDENQLTVYLYLIFFH